MSADFGYLFGQIGGGKVEGGGIEQAGGDFFAGYVHDEFVAVVGLADGVAEGGNKTAFAVGLEHIARAHQAVVVDTVGFVDFKVVFDALFDAGLGFGLGGEAQGGFAGERFAAFGGSLGGADVGDFEAELSEGGLHFGCARFKVGQAAFLGGRHGGLDLVGKLPDGFGRLAAEGDGFGFFLAAGGKRGGNQEGEDWADEGVHVWISLAGWE